ncbi:MAG: flagellar basal body-associated protein FliL [Vampirovibrionia bacterium]
MARPTQPKDPKPKAEAGAGAGANALGGVTGIIINAVLTIVLMAIFIGANYFMVNSIVSNAGGGQVAEDPHGEEGHGESVMSFPYDLEDFIINLHSAEDRRYLKVKISLDIERHEGEPEIGAPPAAAGGHGGHGGGAAVDPKEFYGAVMTPYKMPIRDVIITKISSMSAEELSSTPGKEIAKDLIKEEINTILPEDRQVIRVNFGDFIIQ